MINFTDQVVSLFFFFNFYKVRMKFFKLEKVTVQYFRMTL